MTAANPESILESVKKVIGFDPDYDAFDLDVTMQINMAFGILRQLGVGSDTGFVIQDNTTLWSQYVTDFRLLSMIKAYIFLRVRLIFDMPQTSFAINALEEQIKELGWRISVAAEEANPPADPFAEEPVTEGEPITVTGGIMQTYFAPKIVVLDYDALVIPGAKDGNVFYLTLLGDCTFNAPADGVDGQHITIQLTSAGHDVTWGAGWNFGSEGAPALTPDKTDIISAVFRESTAEWYAGYATGF